MLTLSAMAVPEEILDDIATRFIINVPIEERQDIIRIMFQVELAHWFYLDLLCGENARLPKFNFKAFALTVFAHVPFLRKYLDGFDQVLDDFRTYKSSVPTYGAIILDPDMQNCLLVQGFYSKTSWGFPKGKINHVESPKDCAIREVREETGFDCSDYIMPDTFIEKTICGTLVRLYIVRNVSLSTKFETQTRCEIKQIKWFDISTLPEQKTDLNSNQFFMVMPFVKSLRELIKEFKKQSKGSKEPKKKKRKPNQSQTPQSATRRTPTSRQEQRSAGRTPCATTPRGIVSESPREFIDLHKLIREARGSTARTHSPVRAAVTQPEPVTATAARKSTASFKGYKTALWDDFELNIDWPSIWQDIEAELRADNQPMQLGMVH